MLERSESWPNSQCYVETSSKCSEHHPIRGIHCLSVIVIIELPHTSDDNPQTGGVQHRDAPNRNAESNMIRMLEHTIVTFQQWLIHYNLRRDTPLVGHEVSRYFTGKGILSSVCLGRPTAASVTEKCNGDFSLTNNAINRARG
jgi:hypothetical protein